MAIEEQHGKFSFLAADQLQKTASELAVVLCSLPFGT